jgi:quercetin dioxygenase-like cupin family protein
VSEALSQGLIAVERGKAETLDLPGRQWGLLLGPENVGSKNATLGFAVFPGGSAPPGHVHPSEEEMVYVTAGRGRLVSERATVQLFPGVAVYIPPGTEHSTIADEGEPLHLITVFSPPTAPGSYEPG